jgi:hypothetical protein
VSERIKVFEDAKSNDDLVELGFEDDELDSPGEVAVAACGTSGTGNAAHQPVHHQIAQPIHLGRTGGVPIPFLLLVALTAR